MNSRLRTFLLAAAFLAALAARLALLRTFPGNYDTESYGIVAGIARRGGDVYRETLRYNYSPLWAGVVVGAEAAARAAGDHFELCSLALTWSDITKLDVRVS